MRHGQTNWNINKVLQGQTNIDLNETGINQAKAKIEEIKNLDINLIFCSPLNRATQTAKIVSNGKIPIIYNNSLIERSFGDFEGKKSSEYSNEYYNYNANLKTNNVEPIQDLCNRVYSFLDEIPHTYKNKKILLVTHGATARAINSYFNGLSKDGYVEKISIDNCTLKEFEYFNF
jgi:broad specificity phosphatase PhoE